MTCPKREHHTSRRHQEESEILRRSALMASHQDIACETHIVSRFKGKQTVTGRRVETDILEEIKKIKDTFSPKRERDNRNVPFIYLIRLFDTVIEYVRESEYNKTVRRILIIAEKIEKMIGTLLIKTEINCTGNTSYT